MRNKKTGLKTRSLILNVLTEKPLTLRDLRHKTGLKPSVLGYHLKLLEKHNLIRKKNLSKRKVMVEETGSGQKMIKNFLEG